MELRTYSGPSTEWLWESDKIEAACRSVSVGGLAADLGMIDKTLWSESPAATDELADVSKVAPVAK